MKVVRRKNSRRPTPEERRQQKIKKAQAAKPTAADINRRGLTPEQVQKLFGASIPQKTQRILKGQKGGKQSKIKNKRPRRIITHSFAPPPHREFQAPDWFKAVGDVDVSIIVPMFKSKDAIEEQILNWDMKEDGLKKEIIYVDDSCPNSSFEQVINSWNLKKTLWDNRIGRIILNDRNAGFPHSCNIGAQYASGKYLIFLNADVVVTKNWVRPMVQLAEGDPKIGIVGNLQLRKSGVIDSCGSEWDGREFKHIGKDIYHQKRLPDPFMEGQMPNELRESGERQMVTGACFLIKQELFKLLGGFDTEYRIGYWEDSDLCMRARLAGYKVYYEPRSRIYHRVGHSQPSHNGFVNQNRNKFFQEWVETGALDRMNRDLREDAPKLEIDTEKTVVMTAITKGYDELIPDQNKQGARFVAFLEPGIASKTWEVKPINETFSDSNRNAKIHKILPHRYFPEAEYVLWLDGNVQLTIPVQEIIKSLMTKVDFLVFRHPERQCIYREAEVCINRGLDDAVTISRQINSYRNDWPAENGLAECTVMLRRNTPQVIEFSEEWWKEIEKGSKRDQLSFPIIANKYGLNYGYFPGNLRSPACIFRKRGNHRRI